MAGDQPHKQGSPPAIRRRESDLLRELREVGGAPMPADGPFAADAPGRDREGESRSETGPRRGRDAER